MALVFDLIETRDLLDFTRTEADEQNRNVFTLSRFLPERRIDDLMFRFLRGNFNDTNVAEYRTFDTEAPIDKRQGVRRISGELPPISRKIPLTEEERLRKEALDRGTNTGIVDQLYDDVAQQVRGIQARLELARGEALHSGRIVLNENGVQADVDFGRAPSHTVVPPTLWADLANSDPLRDFLAWNATYIDTNGVPVGRWVTSTTVANLLLRNEKMRQLAGNIIGTPTVVSPDTLRTILSSYAVAPIEAYDTKVRVNDVATRVIPESKVIGLPPAGEELGRTFSGVTAEALELRDQRQIVREEQPGIVAVISKSDDPVHIWTKASAIALPILGNPDLTISATVL